jgi:hypothetical protein
MQHYPTIESFSIFPLILSEDGWKDARDIQKGENVYTLNPNTREIEIQQVEDKQEIIHYGDVYRIKGRNINTIVNPDQKFYIIDRYGVSDFIKIEDIYNDRTKYSHSCIPKSGLWNVKSPEFYTLKGLKNVPKKGNYLIDPEIDTDIDYKTFAQFLGIWLAEGWTDKGNESGVFICQKKEHVKNQIKEMLSRFPKEMEWRERSKSGGEVNFYLKDFRLCKLLRENFGTCCYNKKIPKEFKNISADLLNEMIYWFNLGDGRFSTIKQFDKQGNIRNYKARNIFSTSKQLMLDFNEILLKSGSCGNMNIHIPKKDFLMGNRVIKAENCAPIYFLSIATTKNIHLDKRFLQIEKIETQNYTITQIKVPNETLYTMHNEKAFWSGSIM